jgi:predicted RNase H-like HicB family nuclease
VPKHFTVSDGELVLFLWPAEEGGYNVTSPLDPALITQAETVEEAFVMAHDAWELLKSTPLPQAGPGRKAKTRTQKPIEVKRSRRSSV